MFVDTTYRSNAPEIMDDFSMEGELLRDALDKIASINQLLGGNKVTLQGVAVLLKDQDKNREITIADIGCGNGDLLRTLADYARKENRLFKLIGIDANAFTINHARSLSADYENIRYQCGDIFEDGQLPVCDLILCTLTLHHFKDPEIMALLQVFNQTARLGFVVNDLHRSRLAYYLFKALCFAFGLNEMSREDGLVSILRGFKRNDLVRYADQLNFKNYILKWKWAFRYQWVVTRQENV